MSRPTTTISASFIPRVVSAGVPTRMPEVTMGFSGSKGIMFLFTVMPGLVERALGDLAGEALGAQVDEHQVVVGAAADQPQPAPTAAPRPAPGRWPPPAAA